MENDQDSGNCSECTTPTVQIESILIFKILHLKRSDAKQTMHFDTSPGCSADRSRRMWGTVNTHSHRAPSVALFAIPKHSTHNSNVVNLVQLSLIAASRNGRVFVSLRNSQKHSGIKRNRVLLLRTSVCRSPRHPVVTILQPWESSTDGIFPRKVE